jgi:tight adherence protein B
LSDATSDLEQLIMKLEAGERIDSGTFASMNADTEVGTLLSVCRKSGAPMLEALRSLQSARAQVANTAQELLAELAGPHATVKLVTWLPVGVVILAQGLGFDILGALATNLLAQLSVLAGVALLVVASRWSIRMVRAATPCSDDPAAGLNLFIALLKSGQPLPVARQSVDEDALAIGSLLATARTTGAPLVDLLDARARALREQHATRAKHALRQLSVRLTIPLGAAVLPALVCLVVIPLFISLTSTSEAF